MYSESAIALFTYGKIAMKIHNNTSSFENASQFLSLDLNGWIMPNQARDAAAIHEASNTWMYPLKWK